MKKIVYISQGNIPSKWAHTFQAMKQADAMSQIVSDFRLLTSQTLLNPGMSNSELKKWYGIYGELKIVKIPISLRSKFQFHEEHRYPRFDWLSSVYAKLARPNLVYTRSPGAAAWCVQKSLPTLFETHAPGQYDISLIADHIHDLNFLGLVTISPELRNDYARQGVPVNKILVCPDAVDIDRYKNSLSTSDARKLLKIRGNKPVVVYCGHFYPEKGVGTLIQAARRLPQVSFYLVGGWPEDIERLRNKVRDVKNIKLVGFVSNDLVPVWLNSADLLVLPNSNKFPQAKVTSPLKLYEYMAVGKPVIVTDIPALKEVVGHEKNVIKVFPDSPKDMSDAISMLLRDKNLSNRLSENAKIFASQNTWYKRAERIFDFLDSSNSPVS